MNAIDREQFAKRLETARIKPRMKRDLRFVPEEISDWESRDFLAATNRSRSEGVLVFGESIAPFRLQNRKPNANGRTEAIICDICATWQRGSNSAVITFMKENSTQSFLCCADLDCSLHVRDKTPQSKLSRTQLRENISLEGRVERLNKHLQAIISALQST